MIVRAPAYLARFRCVGSACEDHCCGGWQGVDVDAPTYERYLGVDDPTLGPLLRLHVIRNEDPAATPTERAVIDVTGDGGCPFLTGERLCSIQGTLGEALLPTTCDTFPRLATLIDGTIDVGARLACPEIARLVLLDPDALAIGEVEADRRLRERGRFWVEAPWLDEPDEGDPRRHYHRVRARCLELLRQRDAPLGTRLRALGLALGELSGGMSYRADSVEWAFAEATRQLDRVRDAEAEAARRLDRARAAEPRAPARDGASARPTGTASGRDGGRRESDGEIDGERREAAGAAGGPEPAGEGLGMLELLLARVRVWVAMRGVPVRYRRCLDRLRDGLALPSDPSGPLPARTHDAYKAALEGHVRPYLRVRPYLLENVLANYVHLSTFPYHPARSFAEEYAALNCRAAMLVVHLVGAAAAEGGLTDDLVVETVQAFEKYVDSPDYWERALALLRRHDALALPRLWALIPDA